MDYRALGELIFMSLMGLSALAVVMTVAFHFVLRPFLENLFLQRGDGKRLDEVTGRRLEALESRVIEMETELDSVRARQDFDRQLKKGE